ncbi:MAG: hypothetical protein NTV93_00585 [Verrucomicrobia bacterium]|nr:hypothetical protein [Verrucomicrobiota bacterium]
MATSKEDYWSIEQEPPAFYRIKKTPMSSDWTFQLHRRYENRSRYRYRTAESQAPDGAYSGVALIVFLSFAAGSLLSAVILHFF